MGSGSSVIQDPESDTATLPNSRLFAPIVDLYLEAEELKKNLAKIDAVFIYDVLGQLYIPHTKLIDRVACYGRSQLLRTREAYATVALEAGNENTDLLVDMKTKLSGPYGEFMRSMFMTKKELLLELLGVAVSGLGCDEELIIQVLCCTENENILAIKKSLENHESRVISFEKLIGKTKKRFTISKIFITCIEKST
jgi:hypothetical protein